VTKGRQGFASMDPALVRAIARLGGTAAHAKGTAHRWTRETARAAALKAGRTRWRRAEGLERKP